ncbi:MAG TPA: hypothetical protein VFH78_06140 [Candidatus Thermoplasmatota archaeon]|nr:hypothetical protein [Candidatus Thermoplasmatota archaeon]
MRLLPILLVLLLAGCSAPAPSPDGDGSAAEHAVDWSIRGRGTRELNFEMRAGASIAYELEADAVVRWDIHSHVDHNVTTHASGLERAARGTFTAPEEDTYSIFVQATGETSAVVTNVTVRVRGAFTVVS